MFISNHFFIGITHDLWLVGIFHASFNIRSFPGERLYVVSLNISICFEDEKPCNLTVQILQNTRLPRRLCSWETKYYIESKDYLFLRNFFNPLSMIFLSMSYNKEVRYTFHAVIYNYSTCGICMKCCLTVMLIM